MKRDNVWHTHDFTRSFNEYTTKVADTYPVRTYRDANSLLVQKKYHRNSRSSNSLTHAPPLQEKRGVTVYSFLGPASLPHSYISSFVHCLLFYATVNSPYPLSIPAVRVELQRKQVIRHIHLNKARDCHSSRAQCVSTTTPENLNWRMYAETIFTRFKY